MSRNVGCGSVYGSRAIILRSDGRVTVDGCNETWHRTLRDVVQMEVSADLFCTRDRSGAVACVDLEGTAHLEPQVLASFDGRTGYTDLAVASRTVCALHATGSVSCASGDSRREDAVVGSVRGSVYVLPQTGIRDIAFHENVLCLLDASGVLCDGLGGDWLGVAVQVSGLPPVRRAAFSEAYRQGGCAIDRDHALWCWDEREPVRQRANVRAVTLMDATTFTLDSDGTLRAQGRRGSGVSLAGFWPTAPDDLELRADGLGTVSQGDATVVCGAASNESGHEVRCAEVRFRGVSPESLVAIPTSEAHRAWILRRHGASELDPSGTWWLNDGRYGLQRRVRLRDDMGWAAATPMASVLFGIDRQGGLWITARNLEGRIPAPTGPSGWLRFSP